MRYQTSKWMRILSRVLLFIALPFLYLAALAQVSAAVFVSAFVVAVFALVFTLYQEQSL